MAVFERYGTPTPLDTPAPDDDSSWTDVALYHLPECGWVKDKGTVSSPKAT